MEDVRGRWDDQARPATATRPGRRACLRMGAGCAVPLLAGELSGVAGSREPQAAEQEWSDPVLDHIRQELVRTYRGVRSAAGARGEHVRALAVNLDLMGAYLQSRKHGERADAALRRRVEEKGREAAAQELMAAYGDVTVEIGLQYGVASRASRDVHGACAALDTVTAHGVMASLRGPKAALYRLAALLDRSDPTYGGKARLLVVRQKPGDDFLGYPPIPFHDMTWCEFLTNLVRAVETTAAILGVLGFGPAAGGLAVAVEVLELMRLAACKENVQP
jgi:hypothetical protein